MAETINDRLGPLEERLESVAQTGQEQHDALARQMIDALGDMTERCFKAEAERDHHAETSQQRWEERNSAREVAKAIRLMWMSEDAKASAGAYEDLRELEERFGWLLEEE